MQIDSKRQHMDGSLSYDRPKNFLNFVLFKANLFSSIMNINFDLFIYNTQKADFRQKQRKYEKNTTSIIIYSFSTEKIVFEFSVKRSVMSAKILRITSIFHIQFRG